MASGQEPIRVGSQPPFAVPPERRDPPRRLRGRLVTPVTVWTAGRPPGGAGLTASSVLVAEGQPARLLGLIDPTSAFWEAAQETRAFVVHALPPVTGPWPSGSLRSAHPSEARSSGWGWPSRPGVRYSAGA